MSRPGSGIDTTTFIGNGEPSGPSSNVPGSVSRRMASGLGVGVADHHHGAAVMGPREHGVLDDGRGAGPDGRGSSTS